MKSIKLEFPNEQYYRLVEQAAREHQDVEEYVKSVLEESTGIKRNADYVSFEELAMLRLNLTSGTQTTKNVLGVLEQMRQGKAWREAVEAQAEEYASENENIDSAETYSDTVRDCCTRRINLTTDQFKQEAQDLIDEYGDSSVTKESTSRLTTTETGNTGYIVHLDQGDERLVTFGVEENKNQAEVMADVVNYLIEDYNLVNRIEPLPYVVQTKALINDRPTYPDSNERMRHYQRLTGGYYLDTHYSKSDKKRRLEDLANQCDLTASFAGKW